MGILPEVKPDSIVLLSGGLDSAANLAIARERGERVVALTCDYGQRAAPGELRASARLCEYYDVRREVIELRWLGSLGGSSLTETARAVPVLSREDLNDVELTGRTARSVWVPNRNGVLISVAAAFAERAGAARVLVGFNREEAATFPDNTSEFMERASRALALSTANGVRVASYTAELDKRGIVAALLGLKRPFPFDRVWSCYHGGESPCGSCESCRRFSRAREGTRP